MLTVSEYEVFEINETVPYAVRKDLAQVAQVAQRAMAEFPTGYDGTVTEDDQHLYILAYSDRGIGMAVVANTDRCWHFRWNGEAAELVDSTASRVLRKKIARIWIAKSYRTRGLGTALVQAIAAKFNVETGELGWEIPFTSNGRRLVRRLAPVSFYGDGDRFAIDEILNSTAG